MAYNFTPVSAVSVVAFLIIFYVFLDHLLKSEKTEVNTIFSLLLLSILAWSFGSIFEISSSSDATLLFWKKFSCIGITFIGVLWLTLAVNITTGADHVRLFRSSFFILLGPNLIALSALFTNRFHHLFFREITLERIVFGPFFYLAAFFFFLYFTVGIFLYLVHLLQHREWCYRRQSLFIVLSAVIPLIAHFIYVVRAFDVPYDVTPITFSISAVAFFVTISRYGLFDIIPIAHRYMVNSMKDGLVVLDRGGALIEINQAARDILGLDGVPLLGQSSREIIASGGNNKIERILEAIEKAPSSHMEVITTMESFPEITVDVSVSSIRGDNSHLLGKLAVIRDVTERVNAEKKLHELSIRDDLTSLFNQRFFYRLLNREIHRADRQGHSLSLLVLDIDCFKEYNDHYGHIAGNKVLAMVGELLLENVRNGVDSAFRFGGDEFIAVLPETGVEQATNVAERVRASFEKCGISGLTLSLGIAEYGRQCEMEDLFEMADQAMYKAKRSGRNRLHVVRAGEG